MNAIKTNVENTINNLIQNILFSSDYFSRADANTLRAEEGLLIGAMAYYAEQQALIAKGAFLFTPTMRDIVRDYLDNTLDMLQSEAKAINNEAEAFEYARMHEME